MTFQPRPYQIDLIAQIRNAWDEGHQNVAAVLATGGGKTVIFSTIIAEEPGASCAIAHRQELVSQMSLTLARKGIRHRVIGPLAVGRTCTALHMAELGINFVDPTARAAVAGVDTLIRMDARDPWFAQVKLVVCDEGHHALKENKWGKAFLMFTAADVRGLLVTATLLRADGKGLGRHADGLIDVFVEGPGMRPLIRAGYLTDYRIFSPPSDLDLSQVGISAGGDYSPPALRKAVHKSHITGDVVANYLRIAPGKLGVTFAVDIEAAAEICAAYRAAGVPAEVVTSKTPDVLRAAILRRFRARQVMQLCNCDLFGEGFDLPAIEVVSMARPTESFGLYCQQFGRALRPLEGKTHALIIDHVGNCLRFGATRGLPDTPQAWSLDRRERAPKGKPSDAEPARTCTQCAGTYTILEHGRLCPYCQHADEPAGRTSPAQVDGVLDELDPEFLRALRREVERVDGPVYAPDALGDIARRGLANRHGERQQAQAGLRRTMALWAGWQTSLGRPPDECQRRWFTRYGMDSLTAMALGTREAEALEVLVREQLTAAGVVEA